MYRLALALAMASTLAACGGGGTADSGTNNGNSVSSSGANNGIGAGTSTENGGIASSGNGSAGSGGSASDNDSNAVAQRIGDALASGNPTGLQSADASSLLEQAIAEANSKNGAQLAALKSIYGDGSEGINLALNVGTNSAAIGVMASTTATPYIVSDSGAGIAALSNDGAGRGMAYGADVLQWMAGSTKEQQHYPQFLRAFTWLMTGSGSGTLPATIKYASAGYTTAYVKNFITRTGKTPVALGCAVADSSNTCWTNADLIVFGANVTASAGLTAQVQKYLAAGKAVMYLHPNWQQSNGGSQVLAAMGMSLGAYPGNYFAGASVVSVSGSRTIAQSLSSTDKLGALVNSLGLLGQGTLSLNQASVSSSATPFKMVLNELAALNGAGVNIFAGESSYLLHRLLVLWADMQRSTISYGNISRSAAAPFLQAYASDSFLWFARGATTAATAGQGDYMPAAAQTLVPSSDWEDILVTLPQTSGITLIGRGALPAKEVQIEVVDTAGVGSLGIQTSYLRSWGNPLTDTADTYARPLQPHSFTVPLGKAITQFVTPNGGPLMLSYSGATADTVVRLRVKGVVSYAHFDFTRSMSNSDLAQASAALTAGTFGWQTTKVSGGEIQQVIKYAQKVIGNTAPDVYANTSIRDGLFMSNHIVNGYNDAGMTAMVTLLCSNLAWTCDGNVHKQPLVQHFVGWIATCGFLCSGNPIDGSAGIELGWGYAHEMGHNTVQRVMRIMPDGTHGCGVECDNNILASATALRVYDIYGLEISKGHPLDHAGLYAAVVANRATGLSDDALVGNMQKRVWSDSGQDVMRAVNFQLAFQFAKYRSGLAAPDMASTLDYFSLLTKGDRLVAKQFSTATAANYGMGRYATNSISNHDLLYVLSSKIIGRDLRKLFWMYGIALSSDALGSVADLGLPLAPLSFYALPVGKHNQLATGRWLDLEGATPAWPY
ncbi:ImpA family metalloprotease [Janthinobacterium sp. HLX7-2]|uniref:ImpA family metalloprotease n=1 Tax=Janthinobacterium sp. HLX7-2 TaxID=1259331 RepID=UPI003F2883F0